MENLDFKITEISHVIERQNAIGWHAENIQYEDKFVAVIILDGKTEYIVDDHKYLVIKNDIIIFPPGVSHSGRTDSEHPWSFISVIFRMDLIEEAIYYFNKSILIWGNCGESLRKLFIETSRAWTGKNPLYQVKCRLTATEILYQLLLSEMPYHKVPHIKKLEKARNTIQENFRQELSVEELAKSIDMSVSYFRRLFHEAYGCSPMQYIINLRIENARDLLLSGEVNVTEAAHLSGFEDIYYFSTLFKRKTGITPTGLIRKT